MSVIEEYFQVLEKYRKDSGDRTVLLYQIGSFYEVYSLNDDPLCEILSNTFGIRLTLKDTTNLNTAGTIRNPFMVGIPLLKYDVYKKVLLDNNYIVVRYDQIGTNKNKITRGLGDFESPLTQDDIITRDHINNTNIICCIYIECINFDINIKMERINMIVGISMLDVITGKSNIYQFSTEKIDYRSPNYIDY